MGEAGRGLFGIWFRATTGDEDYDAAETAWQLLFFDEKRGWAAVEDHVLATPSEGKGGDDA